MNPLAIPTEALVVRRLSPWDAVSTSVILGALSQAGPHGRDAAGRTGSKSMSPTPRRTYWSRWHVARRTQRPN
jgi:hypothetical protein